MTAATLPDGRHPAPLMVEHDRHGRPLANPYPAGRRRWQHLIAVVGLLAVGVLAVAPAGLPVLGGGAAAALIAWRVLPERLAPTPYPAFLTVHPHAGAIDLRSWDWIRLPDATAVQACNVAFRVPDTLGDPTPPTVAVLCSDDIIRHWRPHDPIHIVTPIDLR